MYLATLMLLGSGELGREFAIAAKRLGCRVIACDRYDNAPAMQVADEREVFPMLDGAALRAAVEKHRPDYIVPEIEAIDTATLADLEREGWHVVPSAKAVQLTMNRDGIRDFAAKELGLTTSRYLFAETRDEAIAAADNRRPARRGQAGHVVERQGPEHRPHGGRAWHGVRLCRRQHARRPARVIVEEFIAFDYEITLLTVATKDGVLFCPPIGHRQEAGDYRESWQPAPFRTAALNSAQHQSRKGRRTRLAARESSGLSSSSAGDRAIFSELSPRPHDTGMVTLIGQNPNRVRASPARHPRPADPSDRAGRPGCIGGDPGRPRKP